MSDTPLSHDDAVAKVADLIRDIHVCMLTTVDPDGAPWSRPMGLQAAEFDGDLWFFTRSDSEKVTHIEARPHVGVAFAAPSDNAYVTMAGTGRVSNDAAKKKELWAEPLRAWFPDGLDDPELRLIQVSVDRAEYWDSPASPVVYALGYLKARLTGEPADDLGDNQKVDL